MQREIIIRPTEPWWKIDFKELWDYRELFFTLAWRDVVIRYKQTLLGVTWVVFQPIVTTGIFTILFGKIAKIPSDGLPYPLFTLIGLAFWNFFAAGVTAASNSLIANSAIITKVYFPRTIVPIASIVTSVLDFFVTLVLVILALIYFGYFPSWQTIYVLPIILVLLIVLMSGLGMMLASLNVRFHDVRFILPFFIQIGIYLSPIVYPLSVIYDYRRIFLILNPLTAVVETARALVLNAPISWNLILIGYGVAFLVFFAGLWSFRQTESLFVDVS